MKSLAELCRPRRSIFDRSRRDVVLDLTDLIDNKIKANEFFDENYPTDGMKRLLREAFRRFAGDSEQGVFVLTQAMGGGKTHNMIALGLLAQHPALRAQVMDGLYQSKNLGVVRVVAFTGRESDAPYGVWGAIASQLEKKEVFSDYYSPLAAPGQKAWVNLLKGEPLLILLDELPPYLDNARAKTVGNSDLAQVTTTALSNLLVAVGREELSNVCVVISDLRATYEGGSQQLNSALQNLQAEVGRGAMTLEPVGMNTDEVYHILRKRLFEKLPPEEEVWQVARAYGEAVRDARQMDITQASPEQFAAQIKDSYPFHFAIRDLYARFRENPSFQQTRGLIRLMRTVVARLYEGQQANNLHLIHAHDLDLNDRETLAEVTQINTTLDNAISHDIASEGGAIAEIMDANLGGTDAQDVCKLLLVSSLGNAMNAVLGLSLSEIISYLCAPGRDVSRLPKDVLGVLSLKAWYLHSNRDGKLYFRNVQNLVAKLKTTAESFGTGELSRKELKSFLEAAFAPTMRDCYQEVVVLAPIDEIDIKQDKVTLLIYEPHAGGGLHPDLRRFYEDLDYKNRILFLAGARSNSLEALLETAAQLRAIGHILGEMNAEKVPDNDPQRVMANEMMDKIRFHLLSALRETFTTLHYPHSSGMGITDFLMTFTDNNYSGEKQIRETLKTKQKFTEDITNPTFKQKCEARLFTQQQMQWSEVKKRAATATAWQWHHPDALDRLRDDSVHRDQWREAGGYVEKGPFPAPSTEVRVQEISRNEETGEVTLRLLAVHGDRVLYEVGGQHATSASLPVADLRTFATDEFEVSFLCVDPTGKHETGPPEVWRNRLTVKSRIFQQGGEKMVELRAAPPAPIRYTTDGSDPKLAGGLYESPFPVPKGTRLVLAVAEKNGAISEPRRIDINWDERQDFTVNAALPARWMRPHKLDDTRASYEFLERLKKHGARANVSRVTIAGSHWLELSFDEKLAFNAVQLEDAVNHLRGLLDEGNVILEASGLEFANGQALLDWVEDVKTELKLDEVQQQ